MVKIFALAVKTSLLEILFKVLVTSRVFLHAIYCMWVHHRAPLPFRKCFSKVTTDVAASCTMNLRHEIAGFILPGFVYPS